MNEDEKTDQTPDPKAEQKADESPKDPTAGDKKAGDKETKFTQADLDRHAAERAKHAKSAERAALLKELGIEDVDAAKKALKDADDLRKAQMTESEKLKADKDAADKALAEAKEAAAKAQAAAIRADAERVEALRKAAFVSQAAGRFANPDAAYKLADLGAVKLGDDGRFEGIDEALNALAEAEPWTLLPKGQQGQQQAPRLGKTNGAAGGQKGRSEDELRQRHFSGGGSRVFEPKDGGVIPLKE